MICCVAAVQYESHYTETDVKALLSHPASSKGRSALASNGARRIAALMFARVLRPLAGVDVLLTSEWGRGFHAFTP